MRQVKRMAALALAAAFLLGGPARAADDELTEVHQPRPGLAAASALINLVFLPFRLPLTLIGAEFAGLTGFLTFGGEHAAADVFGLVDGTQVITPKVLEGRKEFTVGKYD